MRALRLLPLLSLVSVVAAVSAPHGRPAPVHSERKTVAVLSFTNGSGDPRFDPLGKGIAAMMITDLSSVTSIRLVERERLTDLTRELSLQQSELVDPQTAATVGKLAGAQYVVTGAITALDPLMRLDTRVLRVETGDVVKTAEVTGEQKKFFDLQQKLARELIKGLDVALTPEDSLRLEQQQASERVDDIAVQLHFAEALHLYDQEEYFDAAAKMGRVLHEAPGSTLMQATYKVMTDRAKQAARKKLGNKLRGWLRGQE